MRSVDLQYRFLTKKQGVIWIHHHAAPVQGKDGKVMACGVWTDITEQVNAASDLHQTEKMQALGRLAGGVAHDFNNQIAAISGCAEILAKKTATYPALLEYVRHIRTSADLASSLTEQLLTFSRKTVGRERPENAHALVHQTVSMLTRSLASNIQITECLNARNAVISADGSRLQNAVLNLCLNASDAMPNGGNLTVSTRDIARETGIAGRLNLPPADYLCIEVADTGHGMDDGTRMRIFDPFFTTKPEGKGYGLLGVLDFVKNCRGAVDVTSAVNVGTTFFLYLPICEEKVALPSDNQAKNLGRKHTILIVDEEPAPKIDAALQAG
jgi:signal transduction histidine kinase